MATKRVACVNDPSSHGGYLSNSNTDGSFKVMGEVVCVQGASHVCPISGHGTTLVSAIAIKSYCNGKLTLTEGAVAGCGAVIQPIARGFLVE